ncbi:MAG: hypothetical protein AAF126_17220, partial [Chloroflexota bacterium]
YIMPIDVSWYTENKIIICHCYGDLSDLGLLRQTQSAINQLVADTGTEDGIVHQIFVFKNLTKTISLGEISAATDGVKPHKRTGWTLLVGIEDRLQRVIAKVAVNVTTSQVRLIDSLEEAITFLDEIDSSRNNEE